MEKKIIILVISLITLGCADQIKRQKNLQSLYPSSKVEPATGLIQNQGFDFIVIDTTGQIIAVDYYLFSEKKIFRLRNIR